MRILIFGAGVIGSVYGGRLAEAGHQVTLLARGARKAILETSGLLLEDVSTERKTSLRLPIVETVEGGDYDLCLVAIRDAHLDGALGQLKLLSPTVVILFMINCPLQVERLTSSLGAARVFFAFAGAGGVHEGAYIRYTAVREQPTTIGSVRGQPREAVEQIAKLFPSAGFTVDVVADMEAWLLSHAVLITALCGALYRNAGVSKALARDRSSLNDMIKALQEGFAVVSALGFQPSPAKLRLLIRLPRFVGRHLLSKLLASDFAQFAIDGHANAAPEDMQDLARDCRVMIARGGLAAPTLQHLCSEVDRFTERATANRIRRKGVLATGG